MNRNGWIILGLAAWALLAAGCSQQAPGRTRVLGAVGYESAFAAAREVMSQYYSIESADADAGVIKSRPSTVNAKNERLLGGSPARQIAEMHLWREEKLIFARAQVKVQRQGSAVYHQMRPAGENYDSVPNETPAELDAATTPEQNEAWQTAGYAHDIEQKMLTDLYKALHPAAPEK